MGLSPTGCERRKKKSKQGKWKKRNWGQIIGSHLSLNCKFVARCSKRNREEKVAGGAAQRQREEKREAWWGEGGARRRCCPFFFYPFPFSGLWFCFSVSICFSLFFFSCCFFYKLLNLCCCYFCHCVWMDFSPLLLYFFFLN